MLTIEQIKDTVSGYFKDKPVAQYLSGSYARGEINEGGDVDLAINMKENRMSFVGIRCHGYGIGRIVE